VSVEEGEALFDEKAESNAIYGIVSSKQWGVSSVTSFYKAYSNAPIRSDRGRTMSPLH
jgi:hypothetical protein